jgi:hypothetical protein
MKLTQKLVRVAALSSGDFGNLVHQLQELRRYRPGQENTWFAYYVLRDPEYFIVDIETHNPRSRLNSSKGAAKAMELLKSAGFQELKDIRIQDTVGTVPAKRMILYRTPTGQKL